MPLNCPEDYLRLGKHLEEIDDTFHRFLKDSGYTDNTGALGRYPHRSALLHGRVCRKIDLLMDEDSGGVRFDEFFPDIPYTLWAGAWLDEGGTRYSDKGFLIFERLPFSKVKTALAEALSQAKVRVDAITEIALKKSGTQITLRTG